MCTVHVDISPQQANAVTRHLKGLFRENFLLRATYMILFTTHTIVGIHCPEGIINRENVII